MADIDLDAIRARAEAATPGPWVTDWDAGYVVQSALSLVADVHGEPVRADDPLDYDDTGQPDAEFIAHARVDIPMLLDEIERLRALLDESGASANSDRSTHTGRGATNSPAGPQDYTDGISERHNGAHSLGRQEQP